MNKTTKKINIQIKSRWTGNTLFKFEKEGNTVKDTVVEAVQRDVNLGDAYLVSVDLVGANLYGVNLYRANLSCANLHGAYLRNANLYGADLYNVNLRGADLRDTNLTCANLCGADLRGADLRGADLCGADLRGVDLDNAKGITDIPLACPSDGSFIAWKKVLYNDVCPFLVKLLVPEDARRSSATTNKCRCDKALVLDIFAIGNERRHIDAIINTSRSPELLYKVGEMVYPDSFDDNRWNECSHGIHFFINKQEAINY